jgi:hypothetical protein
LTKPAPTKQDEALLLKKLEELKALEKQKLREYNLPHIYSFPWYKWAREFCESKNRMKILTAGNQLSKSSTQIRHVIDLATDKSKWKEYFPGRAPKTFWYIYPDENKINEEFDTKWMEFLPRGIEKDSAQYGWEKAKAKNGKVQIEFRSGVTILFKTWRSDLQSGTLDLVACDEEIPADIYPEINMRVSRYDGMFMMVFTATLNQQFWYQAIERRGHKDERFPQADKWQVSAEYHCKYYEDGSPSPWTDEKIIQVKNSCGSQTEIDRRVHGRFVTEEGVKYSSFSKERNVKIKREVPADWLFYSGVDGGSGGANHPGAISVIAVNPNFEQARLVIFWKGNESEVTTSGDILKKYGDLTKNIVMTGEYYDQSAKDFGTLAERHGYSFQIANKNREEDILNTLFKNQMLDLEEGGMVEELIMELLTLKENTHKTKAKDDGIDSLRYATSSVPWNITSIKSDALITFENSAIKKRKQQYIPTNDVSQRGIIPDDRRKDDNWDLYQEIDEWNDIYGE